MSLTKHFLRRMDVRSHDMEDIVSEAYYHFYKDYLRTGNSEIASFQRDVIDAARIVLQLRNPKKTVPLESNAYRIADKKHHGFAAIEAHDILRSVRQAVPEVSGILAGIYSGLTARDASARVGMDDSRFWNLRKSKDFKRWRSTAL